MLLAQVEEQKTMLQQLTPINQLRVIMGLFVVVILGVFLYIVIKAGSHMVKGFSAAADRLPASTLPPDDDWAKQPLNEMPDVDEPPTT